MTLCHEHQTQEQLHEALSQEGGNYTCPNGSCLWEAPAPGDERKEHYVLPSGAGVFTKA